VQRLAISAAVLLSCLATGCVGNVAKMISEYHQVGDKEKGVTYYVGGAGPVGNVGSLDVPNGLHDAGYSGFIEIFPWQSLTHAGDQINLARNRGKGAELAASIRQYRRRHPEQPINIIALSAGTGVATWALEYLPEKVQVDTVVFLGCSISSNYDLTRALSRIRRGLYIVYSDQDPILQKVVWYTGTVDRSSAEEGVAGIEGFHPPAREGPDTLKQYRKLHNVPYRLDFTDTGYEGGHTDSTSRLFIAEYIGPVLLGDDRKLLGEPEPLPRLVVNTPPTRSVASQPARTRLKKSDPAKRQGPTSRPTVEKPADPPDITSPRHASRPNPTP
jgi:pimeloyl-ACP methyl ester carboxylesterase